jgi:hypothetical protein
MSVAAMSMAGSKVTMSMAGLKVTMAMKRERRSRR